MKINISEMICIKYIEYLLGAKFKKTRFPWLISEKGNTMELDGYNEDLKVGIEYDGKQHFEFIEYFHKNQENFLRRQNDDRIKDRLCIENNIILIRVPYFVGYEDMLDYIKNECKKYNICFEDKKYISVEELDVYHTTIRDRNAEIDKKLEGSNWIRKKDYTRMVFKIELGCNICHNSYEYTPEYLLHKIRKMPRCNNCYHEELGLRIDEIIKESSWVRTSKYVHYREQINIECLNCHIKINRLPRTILERKKLAKCICHGNNIS